MKQKHSANMRPFGQTTISSFLAKPRSLEEDKQPKPVSQSISKTSDFDMTKVSNRTIKVKKNAFSSISSTRNNPKDEKDEENGNSVLSDAIFKQFNSSAVREDDILGIGKDDDENNPELQVSQIEDEPCFDSSKRKNPFGDNLHNPTPKLLVLGGDIKPRPKLKKRKLASKNNREKTFYNHYANGRGTWDGDMEGVDYEEVGCDTEVWEGMGSIMLGGLDWN
ncbi:RNA-binding protein [Carex rostrata]